MLRWKLRYVTQFVLHPFHNWRVNPVLCPYCLQLMVKALDGRGGREATSIRLGVRMKFVAAEFFFMLGMATSLAILLSVRGNWGAVVWPW